MVDSFKEITRRPRPPRRSADQDHAERDSPGEPGGARRVRVRYRGPRNVPEFALFRTDVRPPPVVRLFRGDRTRSGGLGRDRPRRRLRPTAATRSSSWCATRLAIPPSARTGPPRADSRPGTGVDVRRLTLQGPAGAGSAGSVAPFRVGPLAQRLEFALSRLGSPRNHSP